MGEKKRVGRSWWEKKKRVGRYGTLVLLFLSLSFVVAVVECNITLNNKLKICKVYT